MRQRGEDERLPPSTLCSRANGGVTGYRILSASDAYWRPSNQMGVLNTDLAKQLGAETLGARLWCLRPGQASTRHRHRRTVELYVVIEGTGRLRVDDTVLTLPRLSAALVEAETVRQPFNDTNGDQLWLVVGAPPESANTLAMTEEELAWLYPDGPRALPPELDQLPSNAARRGEYGGGPEQTPPTRPDLDEPTDPRD